MCRNERAAANASRRARVVACPECHGDGDAVEGYHTKLAVAGKRSELSLMGWLRDLMAATDPKLRSYGELARHCLDHADWPRDIQPQARSLASLFSKFDRGIEVEWLDDRPEVQVVLAEVLRLPAHALENEIRKRTQRQNAQPCRYRLPDAPAARPLDLRAEALPPGFPDRLLRPGLWEREWWTSDRVNGVELVGHWLRARKLADFAVCTTIAELEQLVAAGEAPLLLHVAFPGAAVVLQTCAVERPLCVVASEPAPTNFSPLPIVSPSSLVVPWLDWLSPLLPREGHFNKQQVLAWLTELWTPALACSFDAVVGLAAFADELGEAALSCTSLKALAELYLAQALERARAAGASEADWLQTHCLDVLCGMSRRAVLDADKPWDASRSHAEWLELIPSEYHRGVDAEWTRLSLQQAGSPLTVADLEKALRAMPPGAFRVVAVLTAARLLREDDNGFRFGPAWLSALVKTWGQESLLDAAAFEWGELALRPHHFTWLLDAVNTRLERGDPDIVGAALELDDDDSPAFVLAIEMLVVAAGRALLLNQELDPEQAAGLLGLQVMFAVEEKPRAPAPRLLTPTSNLALYGTWLLANWAISEQLDTTELARGCGLNPWIEQECSSQQLDAIAAALANQSSCTAFVSGAYALLGRLLQHYERQQGVPSGITGDASPSSATPDSPLAHALFGVARVLRGDGWNAWRLAQVAPHGVESVRSLVAPEAWPYLAKGAWRSWLAEGLPEAGSALFDGGGPYATMFWSHLPDHALRQLLDVRASVALTVPASTMKNEWITIYLERVPQEPELAVRYLQLIPVQQVTSEHFEVLFALLERHSLADLASEVWSTHCAPTLAHVTRCLDQGKQSQARLWLESVPEAQREHLLAHIEHQVSSLGSSYSSTQVCRDWLHGVCLARAPGWPACYALLSQMEQRLKRAARARVAS